MSTPRRKLVERASPFLLMAIIALLWELVCRVFEVSEFVFPAPSAIWARLVEFHTVIAAHAWRTFWVTMVGFALAIVVGVLLGFIIGSSRLAYTAMYPLMTAFNALPKAAFVPILVVWFGIGVGPAVLTAFLISFFPITVNKVAITLAFVGTTVSEMMAANEGIGYMLVSAGASMQMALAFAGLLVVGVMAMLMYELFSFIEKHTTGWAHRGSQAG